MWIGFIAIRLQLSRKWIRCGHDICSQIMIRLRFSCQCGQALCLVSATNTVTGTKFESIAGSAAIVYIHALYLLVITPLDTSSVSCSSLTTGSLLVHTACLEEVSALKV